MKLGFYQKKILSFNSDKLRRAFMLSILLTIYIQIFSQFNPPNPTVPSANISAAKQNIQISNDFSNGKLNLVIPLFNYSYDGTDFPLSIYYNGGNGIKPDELPSIVGLGWGLTSGGFIHRTVRGKPDEILDFQTKKSITYTGSYSNTYNVIENTLHLQDYSYFTNYNKLTNSNWSSSSYASTLANASNFPNSYTDFYGNRMSIYNHHPNYDLVPDEFTFSIGEISGKFYFNHEGKWILESNGGSTFTVNMQMGEQKIYSNNSIKIPRIIKFITLTSSDGKKYTFGSTNMSLPLAEQVFDYSRTSTVIPWYLTDDQWVGESLSDIVPHTWHLTKIENLKTGSIISLNYSFKGWSFYSTKQAWGNGGSNTTNPGNIIHTNNNVTYAEPEGSTYSISRLSAISKVATRAWTLENISYPNGVKIKFNSSKAVQLSSNSTLNGSDNSGFFQYFEGWTSYFTTALNTLLKLNSITLEDNGVVKKEIEFSYIENINERLKLSTVKNKNLQENHLSEIHKFEYNPLKLPLYGAGKSDHWGYYNNKDFFAFYSPPYDQTKIFNYSSFREPDVFFAKAEILTKVIYPTGGSTSFEYEPHDYSKKIDIASLGSISMGTNTEAGGVRIKSILYKDNEGANSEFKTYKYNIPNSVLSSGFLSSLPQTYVSGNALYFNFQSSGFNPIYYRGNHINYSYVTELHPNNGKVVYEYTNYDNGHEDKLPIESNFSTSTRDAEFPFRNNSLRRGKLTSVKTYHQNETLLNSQEFNYEHSLNDLAKDEIRSLYLNESNYASISDRFYPNNILEKKVREFSNLTLVNSNSIIYDYYGNIKEKKVVNSNGTVTRTKFKYSYEYNSIVNSDDVSQGLKNLNTLGLKHMVVETLTLVENNDGSNSKVVNGKLLTYKPQLPFLDKQYDLTLFNPILLSSFLESSVVNGGFSMDSRYNTSFIHFQKYDAKGNVLEFKPNYKISQSFLWDPLYESMVAVVKNAKHDDIAYTSFETEYTGNWSYSSNGIIKDLTAPTGSKSYFHSLANNNQSITIEKHSISYGEYVVSYWSKTPQTVNGTNPTYQKSGRNGWIYYEHKIIGTSVVVNLNGYIDELRLYPASAQMTTYAYEPLIGIKNCCDINSRISTYEYDGLGKVLAIRDEKDNILKRFCYSYAGQQVDCLKYFYNEELCQSFIPSCPPFYSDNGSYNYCVPAKTFSSTISQAHANQLAQNHINTNGQITANSTCFPMCSIEACSNNYTEIDKRCINGVCETGIKVYTSCEYYSPGEVICEFHYEFSDGSWSTSSSHLSGTCCE